MVFLKKKKITTFSFYSKLVRFDLVKLVIRDKKSHTGN